MGGTIGCAKFGPAKAPRQVMKEACHLSASVCLVDPHFTLRSATSFFLALLVSCSVICDSALSSFSWPMGQNIGGEKRKFLYLI